MYRGFPPGPTDPTGQPRLVQRQMRQDPNSIMRITVGVESAEDFEKLNNVLKSLNEEPCNEKPYFNEQSSHQFEIVKIRIKGSSFAAFKNANFDFEIERGDRLRDYVLVDISEKAGNSAQQNTSSYESGSNRTFTTPVPAEPVRKIAWDTDSSPAPKP